jgi:hypothetical protein
MSATPERKNSKVSFFQAGTKWTKKASGTAKSNQSSSRSRKKLSPAWPSFLTDMVSVINLGGGNFLLGTRKRLAIPYSLRSDNVFS